MRLGRNACTQMPLWHSGCSICVNAQQCLKGVEPMNERRFNDGFTLIELLMVVAISGIIVAIAVPGLLRVRMSGNEASAIGSLRAVNSGEAAYSSSCASGWYAVTLEDLFKAPAGSNQGFISPDLQSNGVTKSGYVVTLAVDLAPGTAAMSPVAACNAPATTPSSSYFADADPITPGGTGTRYFATDTRGTIFYDVVTIVNPITITTTLQ